ncbi:MAG: ABC transporter substrate-binding protein [Caldilineaceae bacterium]
MKTKHWLLMVSIIALLVVLAGCAVPVQETQPVAEEGPVTMTFLTRNSNESIVRQLVDVWNGSHDNQIEVTVVPATDFVTKFGTMLASGSPPDIVAVDLIFVPQFAAAGQMTDITEKAKALPYFDQLSPSHIRLSTYEDKIYALPFNAEGSVLFWNKDLFEQAGLDPESPPTTWDEIYEAAKAINALGDDIYGFYFSGACAGCNAFTFLPLIWATGGDVLSEDGMTATLDDPAVKEALEFYRKMWEEGLIPPGSVADTGPEFLNTYIGGKIGMQGLGVFAITPLKTGDEPFDFGVTFLPGKDGGVSSFAGGDSIGIPAGSRYADQAFEFIEWLTSDDVQLEQYAANFSLPIRTDLADNQYFQEDPRFTTAAEAMALGRTPYSLVYNALFNDANGPWLKMLQTAIFDGEIDAAISTAQEEFTKVITEQ